MDSSAWPAEEIQAMIELYAELRLLEREEQVDVEEFLSKGLNSLAVRFNRDSFDYRLGLSAVSGVLRDMGLTWLAQAPPVFSKSTDDISAIRQIVSQVSSLRKDLLEATADLLQLELRSAEIVRLGQLSSPPSGSTVPKRASVSSDLFLRDPQVRAWVLLAAGGICECCQHPAPFRKRDGEPYLEVHHLTRLADGGSDTVDNTVAVCPNCHRRLHYGSDAQVLKEEMRMRQIERRAKQTS